jgi:hypothetical protein
MFRTIGSRTATKGTGCKLNRDEKGTERNSALGISDLHTLSEAGVQELQRGGFDIKKWLTAGRHNRAVCTEY